jgi:hypothetical protein
METFVYKKILFEDLIKRINKTENNKYREFIELYIKNYLSKFKIDSLEKFVKTNESQIQFYKQFDLDCKIYFHYLIDKSIDKIVAIEKCIDISDRFFDIKYFKMLESKYERGFTIYAVNLFVDEEYRGKSLCKKLLYKIQSNSKKHNKKYIISEIHNENAASIKCHESSEFKKTEFLSYPETYFYIANL